MARRADASVPPVRPRDTLLQPTSAPPAPAFVKTSAYLLPEQLAALDARRATHRAAGRRGVTGSDLFRAAIELAERHSEEWDALIAGDE